MKTKKIQKQEVSHHALLCTGKPIELKFLEIKSHAWKSEVRHKVCFVADVDVTLMFYIKIEVSCIHSLERKME